MSYFNAKTINQCAMKCIKEMHVKIFWNLQIYNLSKYSTFVFEVMKLNFKQIMNISIDFGLSVICRCPLYSPDTHAFGHTQI